LTRPTARVLALLEILQGGGTTTVGVLAGRLGVDERTVRRYAMHLSDLGIPVEARRGRYGGYRLAPGFRLPPLMLTDDEAVAVLLGLVAGRRSGLVTAGQAAADSATAKIRRVLPGPLGQRIDALLAKLDVTAPVRSAAPPEAGVLLVLAEAARLGRPVHMRYTSWRGVGDERRFDPYGLVFHSGRWYATGFDHARDAVRTFRLDRVDEVRPQEGAFEVPAGFDPTVQVLAGLAAVPYAHEISVVLRTDLATARGLVPVAVGTLTEVPGGVRLQARAEHLAGAARLLAGLGLPLRVEKPAALRYELRALAARLADA
jgi:predicted DNA-binding transcriptional regulator YafY